MSAGDESARGVKRARTETSILPTATMASSSFTWSGREAAPPPFGSVAVCFELLVPASIRADPVLGVGATLVTVTTRSILNQPLLIDCIPDAALAAAAATPIISALRPLIGSRLYLRADASGVLILSSTPEVFFLETATSENNNDIAGWDDGQHGLGGACLNTALRTTHGGIIRASSDGVRVNVRLAREPAPRGPLPPEIIQLTAMPWQRGGAGAVLMKFATLGTFLGRRGGCDMNLIQLRDTGYGVSGALTAQWDELESKPVLLRPIFRDSLSSVWEGGEGGEDTGTVTATDTATTGGGTGRAFTSISPHKLLLSVLGVPIGAFTGTLAGRGTRAIVRRANLSLSQKSPAIITAVIKSQPWDDRVDGEVAALVAISALYAQAATARQHNVVTLVQGGGGGRGIMSPLLPPIALLRDAHDAYFIFTDGGVSLDTEIRTHGGLTMINAVRAIAVTLSGVSLLASIGRLHADIHPANILLGGESSLIDLGSALPLHAGIYTGPTRGGRWDFMPQEQFGSGAYGAGQVTLTPSSDVFSAGTTLAGALIGVAPFAPITGARLTVPTTLNHKARSTLHGVTQALSASLLEKGMPLLPIAIIEWLNIATSPNPLSRFPHAAAALDALVLAVAQGSEQQNSSES